MTRLGLLFTLTAPERGSVEEVVLALLQRLDPSEFRLALAAPQAILDSFAGDLHGVVVDTEAVQADSWMRRRDVGRLSAFIARVRPHIVNPHLPRSTMVAAPLARWHGAKVVETCHGRMLRGGLVPDRVVSRFVDRTIAVSEAARASLISKGYRADRIVVVPNGRDFSTFRPGAGRDAVRRELRLGGTSPVVGVWDDSSPQGTPTSSSLASVPRVPGGPVLSSARARSTPPRSTRARARRRRSRPSPVPPRSSPRDHASTCGLRPPRGHGAGRLERRHEPSGGPTAGRIPKWSARRGRTVVPTRIPPRCRGDPRRAPRYPRRSAHGRDGRDFVLDRCSVTAAREAPRACTRVAGVNPRLRRRLTEPTERSSAAPVGRNPGRHGRAAATRRARARTG